MGGCMLQLFLAYRSLPPMKKTLELVPNNTVKETDVMVPSNTGNKTEVTNDSLSQVEEQFEGNSSEKVEASYSNATTELSTVEEKVKLSELWKQPTLLNIKDFQWLINNESICKVDPDKRIMAILLFTARHHFKERMAIRKTWGSVESYKGWDVRVIFLMGEKDPSKNFSYAELVKQEIRLDEENNRFGDLVIGSFIDTYRNLTYKHFMGFKWILNFCKNADFVVKVDDDMLIDIMRWLDWRNSDLNKIKQNKKGRIPDLYCLINKMLTKEIRKPLYKWYISYQEYPNKTFPFKTYCNGWTIGLTVDIISKLYSVSNDTSFLWVDDIYIYGILMKIAEKKFHFKPKIKNLKADTTDGNYIKAFRKVKSKCVRGALLELERKEFGAAVVVPRGNNFKRVMNCLWNKTLHDYLLSYSNETNKNTLVLNTLDGIPE